jgi:Resolvase, N terminal domain
MTRTVCRQPSPRRDGERRWDQAYQLLVRWTERGDLPWPAPIAEEVPDARGGLCAGVDHSPSPGQTIEQQLDRLQAAVAERGWTLDEQHVYRDDGYSGTSLGRPGLDRLRDHAAPAELDLVLVTAPDRLARNLRPSGAAAGRAGPARLEGGVSGSADASRSPRSAAAGSSVGRSPSTSAR